MEEITSEIRAIDGCKIADTSPGLEKRRSVSLGSEDDDVANSYMKTITKRSSVSFAPVRAIHRIEDQTQGLEHELWYTQHDFMFFRDQAWLCSQAVLSSQGTYDYSELGDILGLDKFLLHEEYSDRRETLRQTLLVEQEVQKIMCMYSDGGGDADDVGVTDDLAETSERNSCWARERAFIAALTLEHDLLLESRSRENSIEDE